MVSTFEGWRFSALKTSFTLEPKKFEDKELEALLEEDQTQEEFAESLGVTQQAVSVLIESYRNDSKTRKLGAL